MTTVKEEISFLALKHGKRLHEDRKIEAIRLLDNAETKRTLKKVKL